MTTLQGPPICFGCEHLERDTIDTTNGRVRARCTAYPNGIPAAIISDGEDHREPRDGDNGITFELREIDRDMFDLWQNRTSDA